MIVTVLFGVVGAMALSGVYRALQVRWPEVYQSLNETFALSVVQTWWRLVFFRVGPVFVVGLGIAVTSMRLGGAPEWSIAVMIGLHASLTNGRALGRAIARRDNVEFRVNHASYHLSALGLLAVTGWLVGFSVVPLSAFVPKPSVLLESLWTALFVAVAAGALVAAMGNSSRRNFSSDEEYFVWRATRDVGQDNLDWAWAAAEAHGADPILLRALMFAEALQRPRWVRNLERAGGRLLRGGSFGVTQVQSREPITDEEALNITAARLASRWGLHRETHGWTPDYGAIWTAVGPYNGERALIDAVQRLYRHIFYSYGGGGTSGGEVMLHLFEVRRLPEYFALHAITDAAGGAVNVTHSDASKEWITLPGASGGLRAVELRVRPTAISLEGTIWDSQGNTAQMSAYIASARITEPGRRIR